MSAAAHIAQDEAAANTRLTFETQPWRWLRAEIWYALVLKRETKIDVLDGDTTISQRLAAARELVIRFNLADRPVSARSGKAETHRQFFERLYGVPLQSPQESLF